METCEKTSSSPKCFLFVSEPETQAAAVSRGDRGYGWVLTMFAPDGALVGS